MVKDKTPFDCLNVVTGKEPIVKVPEDYVFSSDVKYMLKRIWDYHDRLGHDTGDKVQIIRDGCLALYQEVAELTDSFPWKPWRKIDDQTFDTDNACREMVDIFFFMAKIMRAAGITADDFVTKFTWVLNNNLDRLRNGYSLVKGGDSDGQKD
jgi:hypothetical protein